MRFSIVNCSAKGELFVHSLGEIGSFAPHEYKSGSFAAHEYRSQTLAHSLQDWMLLEWNDRIHVFHGTYDNASAPRTTANASFFNLRAPGALLVSAVRTNGATEFVSITAEVDTAPGRPAVVVTDLVEPVRWAPPTAAVSKLSDGTYSIVLKSSECVFANLIDDPMPCRNH